MPDYTCPHCGWDAVEQAGLHHGDCWIDEWIKWQKSIQNIQEVQVRMKCKCPSCGEIFYYDDGWP